MKKILIFFALFLVLASPLLSAIQFEMKESFAREEVLMAKLSGEFVQPPLRENIFFYRGHVGIAMDAQISKINDDYYIYAPLSGKEPRNYSIVIKDISYMKGSQKITEDLTKNFTITEEYAEFIITPGTIFSKDDFSITLENLQDEPIIITMNLLTITGEEGGISDYEDDEDYEFTVKPGKQTINFKLESLSESTSKLMTFSTKNLNYTIPVSLYIDEQSEQSKVFAFDIWPEEFDLTIPTFDNLTKLVYIYNTGTGLLTDIKLKVSDSLKPYVTISEDRFGQILPNSNANLNLSIVSGSEKTISGKIEVSVAEGLYQELKILIKVKEGYELTSEERAVPLSTPETCGDKGKICLKSEICEGQEVPSQDGVCCIGGLCKKKISGTTWKWLGWIILIVLIIVGVWFYLKKYKGFKKPVDLLKIAQGKKQQ